MRGHGLYLACTTVEGPGITISSEGADFVVYMMPTHMTPGDLKDVVVARHIHT